MSQYIKRKPLGLRYKFEMERKRKKKFTIFDKTKDKKALQIF